MRNSKRRRSSSHSSSHRHRSRSCSRGPSRREQKLRAPERKDAVSAEAARRLPDCPERALTWRLRPPTPKQLMVEDSLGFVVQMHSKPSCVVEGIK